MMKTMHVHPLPPRHVWSLLTLTCRLHANGTGTGSSTYPPKFLIYSNQLRTCVAYSNFHTQTHMEQKLIKPRGQNFRSEFLQVLSTRRTNQVPLTIQLAKPVRDPPPFVEELEVLKCLLNDKIDEGSFKEENLYLTVEEGEQGRLPVLILSLKESDDQHRKRPAVVLLHPTRTCKEIVRPLLQAYASRGYVAISVDSRYHGERASSRNRNAYHDALIDAWKNGKTMPFIYDTVWDLIKLADYLTQRRDVDPSRIGITGISLGGMHAWFAAAVDTRYAVVASVIGVQGFRWAIDNNKWQPRVDSIKPVFEVAREDLGKRVIDREVVEKVWDRIAPGLASQFDSPNSIASIAPRPLLIINGAEDPRCPLGGLEVPVSNARQTYGELDCLNNFKFIAEPGVGHELTQFQMKEAAAWFDTFLKP